MGRITSCRAGLWAAAFALNLAAASSFAAQTVYTFQNITPTGPIQAHSSDVDVFPYTGAADQNDFIEATATEYPAIGVNDGASWVTASPGGGDEIFLQLDMVIKEPIAQITQIDLTFNGFSMGGGSPAHQIWAQQTGGGPLPPAVWDQIGADQGIPNGVNTTMTRSITSNFATYIDAATGAIRWGVYVTTANAEISANFIEMRVTFTTGYEVNPRGVQAYGYQNIAAGATTPRPFTLQNTGGSAISITSLAITGADASQFIKSADSGQTSLNPGQSRTFSIAFDPSTVGVKNAELVATVTGATPATFKVLLTGTGGKPDISVTPPGPIDFGTQEVNAGASGTQVVTIQNIGTMPLNLSSISIVSGDVTQFFITNSPSLGLLQPGGTVTVNLVFDPTYPPTGPRITSLRIVSDDAETPTVDVILKGVAGKAEVSVAPAGPLDFGSRDIAAGPTAPQNIVITNTGTGPLNVTGIQLIGVDSTQFLITNAPATGILQPFGSILATVVFDPTTIGAKSAFLRTTSNDFETPTVDVQLIGTATSTGATPTPSPTPTPSSTTCYTFDGVTGGGAANLSVIDADVFPYGVATDQNSVTALGARDLLSVVADDGAEYLAPDPGNGDETLLQADMVVVEPIALITQIDFTFVGNTEVTGGPPGQTVEHRIYLHRTGTDPLVGTNWDLIGTTNITEGVNTTFTASITSNFANYINPTTGAIRWGIYETLDGEIVHVNQVEMCVVQSQDYDIAPDGIVAFGYQDINDGPTALKRITITNTGVATLNITSVAITGTDASQFLKIADGGQLSLLTGQTRVVDVVFDPATVGFKNANLTVLSSSALQPTRNVALTGTAGKREIAVAPPGPINFGSQEINLGATLAPMNVTITNAGTSPLTIGSIAITGTNAADFLFSAPPVTGILYPGESLVVSLVFDPSAVGGRSGNLAIASNDAETPTTNVALQGTGTKGEISLSPAGPVNFGSRDIALGPTASQNVTISNIGTGPLDITQIAIVGADGAQFLITNAPALGLLNPGGNRVVTIVFDPTTVGLKLANLSVASNDQETPLGAVALTGTGISGAPSPTPSPSPSLTASLSPTPSASPTISLTPTPPPNAGLDWAIYE